MRPLIRAILLTLRVPYFLYPTGYFIDMLPHHTIRWIFAETSSERIERRLYSLALLGYTET